MSEPRAIFQTSSATDWASAWLDALFHDGAVPTGLSDTSIMFSGLSTALRQALSVYSIGMLVLAGFLLLWHITSIIAETAHTGVLMGRRTNQLWAPLRFVLAMGLLVPLSGGLNTGQFIIVKLADQGSSLASRAWQSIVGTTKNTLALPVTPREQNVTHVVMTAVEMELCRGLYNHLYTALQPDALLTRVGMMPELRKQSADRLGDESWRYTNEVFSDTALCGEYSFISPEASLDSDSTTETQIDKTTQALAESTRASTERLALQSRMLSDRVVGSFLVAHADTSSMEATATLTAFMNEQRKIMQNGIKAQTPRQDVEAMTQRLASMGWIGAGEWFLETARQQTALGTTAGRILPDVKAPLFGHKVFPRTAWMAAAEKDSSLRLGPTFETTRYGLFYDKMNVAMKQARSWLYKNQVAHLNTSLPDQLDLTDRLGAYSDGAQGLRIFTRLLNAGMESWGIFSTTPYAGDANGGAESNASLLRREMVERPFASLIEVGRRFMGAGSWMFGMMGPALAEPTTMASAILFSLLSFALLIAGAVLVFLVPFLPFYRYLIAVVLWFLSVFAAVAALPLVALAHINPTGEGLIGPVAKRAYWLWLAVFMRPILTLFGFVMGAIMLYFGIIFLNTLFSLLVSPLTIGHGDSFVFMRVGLALIYAALVFAVTNASFRGVTSFPSDILEWLSGQGGLPEPVVMNAGGVAQGGQMTTLAGAAPALLGAGREAQGAQGAAGRDVIRSQNGSAGRGAKPSRQTDAAHFPQITEPPEKPVVIATAEARAFAKAEGASGSGSIAAAGARAGSDGNHAEAKAMTVHMPDIREPEVQGIQGRILPPEHQGKIPTKPEKTSSEKSESREQSAVTEDGLKPKPLDPKE